MSILSNTRNPNIRFLYSANIQSLQIRRDWSFVRFWELILEVCILLWLFLFSFLEKNLCSAVSGKHKRYLLFLCSYALLFPALAANSQAAPQQRKAKNMAFFPITRDASPLRGSVSLFTPYWTSIS